MISCMADNQIAMSSHFRYEKGWISAPATRKAGTDIDCSRMRYSLS